MASGTPLTSALREALRSTEGGGGAINYVSGIEDGGITIDGWWESNEIETALSDIFKLKGS